jgi:hypothetical protein
MDRCALRELMPPLARTGANKHRPHRVGNGRQRKRRPPAQLSPIAATIANSLEPAKVAVRLESTAPKEAA